MSNLFTITVHNTSSDVQDYNFFNDVPTTGDQDPPTPWSNIWVTSPGVATPNGNAMLNVSVESYAVCGMGPAPVAEGVTIQTSDTCPVSLSHGDVEGTLVNVQTDKGGAVFVSPPGVVPPNHTDSYGIQVGSFLAAQYPSLANIYVGYSKMDAQGIVVPVAVWTPASEGLYYIKYFVATGSRTQGTCVDIEEIGETGIVDFGLAEPGQTHADITQNSDNSWGQAIFS